MHVCNSFQKLFAKITVYRKKEKKVLCRVTWFRAGSLTKFEAVEHDLLFVPHREDNTPCDSDGSDRHRWAVWQSSTPAV